VEERDEIGQALDAIRKASGGDVTVPEHRTRLEEAARLAGATAEQVREAAKENPNWPW